MNHKRELTAQQAIARKQWLDQWEELNTYASRCARRYCRAVFPAGGPDYREIAGDAIGEAYRDVIEKGVGPKKAIKNAINRITYTLARHLQKQALDTVLGEMPDHTQAYDTSADNVQELISHLPKRLRPLAVLLSAGIVETDDLIDYLNCSKRTVQLQRNALAQTLGSRFGYLLGDVMEVPIPSRIAG